MTKRELATLIAEMNGMAHRLGTEARAITNIGPHQVAHARPEGLQANAQEITGWVSRLLTLLDGEVKVGDE